MAHQLPRRLDDDPTVVELKSGLLLSVRSVLKQFADLQRDVQSFCDEAADYISSYKEGPCPAATVDPPSDPISRRPSDFPNKGDFIYFSFLSILNIHLHRYIFLPFHPIAGDESNQRLQKDYGNIAYSHLQLAAAAWRAKMYRDIDETVTPEVLGNFVERVSQSVVSELMNCLRGLSGDLVLTDTFGRVLNAIFRRAYVWNRSIKVDIQKYDFEVFVVMPGTAWDPLQMESFERLHSSITPGATVVSPVALGVIGSASLGETRFSHIQRKALVLVEDWFLNSTRCANSIMALPPQIDTNPDFVDPSTHPSLPEKLLRARQCEEPSITATVAVDRTRGVTSGKNDGDTDGECQSTFFQDSHISASENTNRLLMLSVYQPFHAKFGIRPQPELSQLLGKEACKALDQIYDDLEMAAYSDRYQQWLNLIENCPSKEALELLDQIFADLDSTKKLDRYPHRLMLLQDLCFHSRALPTPFHLSNIQFDRRNVLGRGEEVTLYQGRRLRQDVVIQELFLPLKEWQSSTGHRILQLVHREAITHSQLQHPNIIPFLGIYHDSLNSPPLTIVPFWGRGSLSSMLSRQWPIPTAIFQCILIGITRGVGYLHSQNPPVIHGDLHPGNILLDDFGNPQICGFGTSRICCMLNKTRVARQESKRMRFMAPELITLKLQEINPTQKSDIFSLAMTFFNVWTGRPPFSEVTRDWEVLLGFAKGRRPKRTPQTMLSREMQPALWKLLEKMWNQKPSKRPSIATVIERFKTMFTLAFPYPSPPEYSGGFGTLVYSLSRHNSYPPMTSELPQSLFSAESPEAEFPLTPHAATSDADASQAPEKPIRSELLTKFGLDPSLSTLSKLSHSDVITLLDKIHEDLKSRPQGSSEHSDSLRLLQDVCFQVGCLPTSLSLSSVTFDRRDTLARGGEATIYNGRMGEREVVIREVLLHQRFWKSAHGKKIFRLVHREAITHAQMHHENILPFLGVYHEDADSPPLTIVPFIEGGSLCNFLAGGKQAMDLKFLQRLLLGISRGVEYLHSRVPQVIHGDLHPGNVLLDDFGHAYLCDFGLSRIRHEITRTRTMLGDQSGGSLRYTAPELTCQLTGPSRTSQASDVFSLAMTFLHACSGHKPFPNKRDWEVTQLFEAKKRPKRSKFPMDIPAATECALWDLIEEMWAHEPTDRPPITRVVGLLVGLFLGKAFIEGQRNCYRDSIAVSEHQED